MYDHVPSGWPMPSTRRFRGGVTVATFPGWQAKHSITVVAPHGQANVIGSAEPTPREAADFAAVQARQMRTDFPSWVEDRFHRASAFGLPGWERQFRWTPPDGMPIRQVQRYAVLRGYGATMTATAPDSAFDQSAEAMRTIMDSFELAVDDGTARLAADPADGWLVRESVQYTLADGSANVIMSSEPLTEGLTLADYAGLQGELLAREFAGYEQLGYERVPVLGLADGFRRRFTWTPVNGVPVTQVQLYALDGGRGVTATATTPSTAVGTNMGGLERLLDALRYDPPAPG